uniref:Flavin-containing monooxygenase n=1 Tax=Dendroctonus ponderosae TaxID=77166 RepID=A0AAR5NXM6_DENPD
MKIGIVGAGAAGLAALRHSLQQGHECVVFEKTDKIGGTWNYTDDLDVDSYGLPVHSSMYQGLMTNLPKELMEYEDFPYSEVDKSFIDQKTVLNYIERFADRYNLHPYIKFLHHVIRVNPLPNNKWAFKEENLKTKEITDHTFDAIMICIGNYSVPKLPEISGMELLGSKAIHSHNYRKSDAYEGKKVLVIGAGPSGIDIARLVGKVADKVFISRRDIFL